LIAGSRSLTVLTGAGVSAESGIPTFRDALEGLWSRYRAEELATPEAFARDPEVVTRWYDERRSRCADCEPNPGHHALAELQRRVSDTGGSFVLLTQNVDRLHQRAGSTDVVELHGSLWQWRCTHCGDEREELDPPFDNYPPRCDCGGARRPGVIWFGEMLPARALDQAYRALQSCDLFLSIGTSAVVEPAASFVTLAAERGATTIEINLQPTPITDRVDHSLLGRSGELLPRLLRELDV
jgi:NAD-dependent deacetylase